MILTSLESDVGGASLLWYGFHGYLGPRQYMLDQCNLTECALADGLEDPTLSDLFIKCIGCQSLLHGAS